MTAAMVRSDVTFGEIFAGHGVLLDADRGETIFHPGAAADVVYLVETGMVKISYLDESGKKLTLGLVGTDEIFGEMGLVGDKQQWHLATAIGMAIIRVVEIGEAMKAIASHEKGLQLLVEHFAARARRYEESLEDLAFRDIEARLSRQLLALADEFGEEIRDGTLIGLAITHKELADMIGAVRENVTLALNRFVREGVIEKSRYRIVITDEGGLRKKISTS